MSRYIDADALIEELNRCSYVTWSKDINRAWWAQAVKVKDNIKECIKKQPAADVVEVRHGKWVVCGTFDDFITCSVCKGNKYPFGYDFKYCPECGAKMDGERSENGK